MATREELYTALRNADKAGDAEGARKIAAYIQSLPAQESERAKPATLKERAMAVPAGFNSFVASVAGLPMDTAANVVDLGKAGIGSAYQAITGKAAPRALQITPRENVIGTGAWFRTDKGSPRAAYAVPRPDDATSRYLAAAGAAIPATMIGNPATTGEATMGLMSNLSSNIAGQAAVEFTRNMDPTTQTLAAASGQIMGGAIPNAIASRIAQPTRPALTPGQRETIATADANEIPIDAASRTGSTFLRRMRNVASDNPFTAGGQKEFADTQKTAINRAILRTIGEDAPRATPEVMGRANARIGQVMDDVATRNPVQFDTDLAADIQQVQRTLVRTVPESLRGPIETNIRDILEAAQQNSGMVPGPIYQRVRSALQTLSMDPKTSPIAGDLREALDDALTRSIRVPQDAPALQEARLQWRNMRTIEGAISKDNEGNISPALVANNLGTKGFGNRNRSIYGRGDQALPEIARAGKSIMDQDPNSGTPLRLAGQSAPAMIGGAVVSALTGNVGPAVGLGTLGYGFPRVMQGINNSQAMGRYLARGITPGPLRDALLYPQRPPFVAAAPVNALLNSEEARRRGLMAEYQ